MLIIPGCIKERTAKGFVCGDVRCTLGMHAYFELLRNSPHCVSNNTHEVLRNAVLLSIPVTGVIDILSAPRNPARLNLDVRRQREPHAFGCDA